MKWYEGNIAEAVQKSRAEGAVFGVAILGDDEASKQVEEGLERGEVQDVMNSGKFVCIRLANRSQEHQQFAQIYANASAPSFYLIGNGGAVLEVVKSEEEVKGKFVAAWGKHCAAAVPAGPSKGAGDAGQGQASKPTSLQEANDAVKAAEEAVGQSNLTMEEKIERAHKLAAAKRAQKAAEEAEDAKRRERERREAGKGMAELKRWQEEQEMKKLLEERKKDKKDEAALRQKLREQIAADRAARNARSNLSYVQDDGAPKSETTAPVSVKPQGLGGPVKDYTGQARLQFRLPSGASVSHVFEPEKTLAEVKDFLVSSNHVPFRNFSISIAYPRRQFSNSEYSSSLRDLGLVPSAALLILPVSGSSIAPSLGGSGIGDWITLFVSYLIMPFTFIFSLLRRALPAPGPASPPATTSEPQPSTSAKASSRRRDNPASAAAELRQRKGAGKGESSNPSDGNIHRFRNQDDDEDDNATWNGNSTQQM